MAYDDTIDSVLDRKDDYVHSVLAGSLAGNAALGLGYFLDSSPAVAASKAFTLGPFTLDSSFMQSLGLGSVSESALVTTAGNALTFGAFTLGTSLVSNATNLEQKIIGTGIAAYMSLPVYHTITEMAPIVYQNFLTGLGLVKAGAYIAAIKPLAITAGAAALAYFLVWGISKAVKNLVTKNKKKKKKK